jgi:FkbM family methyltransferase
MIVAGDAASHRRAALPRQPVDAEDLEGLLLRQIRWHAARVVSDNADMSYPPFSHAMAEDALARRREAFQSLLSDHRDDLFEVYRLWGDEESRELFVALMLFRTLGHAHVRLPTNRPAFWRAHALVAALPSRPSPMRSVPGGEALQHFSLAWQGRQLELDCLRANILFSFFLRQYHLERAGVRIGPRFGDHVVDAGACFGDTAVDFSSAVGPQGRIHCFELVDTHLKVLRGNVEQNRDGAPIEVHECGLSDVDQAGAIAHSAIAPGFAVSDCSRLPLARLDSLVETGRIERVDFIKMDIEGHEEAALRGATAVMRRFRPRLAISIYHRWEHYYRLPLMVRDLGLGYRFFLDNHTISDGETVMYCIA